MFACVYAGKSDNSASLSDFAYAFSPVVEAATNDTVVLDIAGCDLLFGSAYQLATEISERAQQPQAAGGLDMKVSVALAANPDTAIHAAKHLKGITFISAGEELGCLGNLPLTALEYSLVHIDQKRAEQMFETLRVWGVHSFSDFASLPTVGVAERFGQDGVKLQQLASGKIQRHLRLKQPPPVFSASIELEHPIAELEPLSFIFARLLNQLCAALNAYALATNEICVSLKVEDQTTHERTLALPYAMRDHKVFLKLLLLDIETHPPKMAVTGVSINCEPVKPRLLQNGLFIPLAPEAEKLELTLARIAKLVGLHNVGSPEMVDTHRPDAFSMKRFIVKSNAGLKKHRRRTKHRQSEIANRQSQDDACFSYVASNSSTNRANSFARSGSPAAV